MAATGERVAYAFPQLSDVELQLVIRIFSLLPADQRLRCAEVCRGWRATVALPALWRRLDLSASSGVAQPISLGLLQAAVARAGGALTAIDLTALAELALGDILAALRASSALLEARLGSTYSVASVTALLAAAPQLRELHCGVACVPADSVAMLQGRPPFAPLRLRELEVWLGQRGGELRADGALEAVADAVVARHLCRLSFVCPLSPTAAPALARMVRDGALTSLAFSARHGAFLDAAAAPLLGDALRANSTLTSLSLKDVFGRGVPVVAAILGSLVGHRSLCELRLSNIGLDNAVTLAALLAADSPPLMELHLAHCDMDEEGWGLISESLPRNSHLHTLNIRDNILPAGFVRAQLLPALRANTGLRTLRLSRVSYTVDDAVAAEEAQQFVAAR